MRSKLSTLMNLIVVLSALALSQAATNLSGSFETGSASQRKRMRLERVAYSNSISATTKLKALEKMRRMEAYWARRANTQFVFAQWFPIGPSPISGGQTYGGNACRVDVSGRASTIAVNPFNPDDVFLGTAVGGVWHSADGGQSWRPLSDNQASLAIGAIALDDCDPTRCATIYVGTGENNIRRDTYHGAGLLIGQTVGSGAGLKVNWELRGHDLFNLASINNVVLDPTTSGANKRLYVSLSSGVTASATESTITAPPPPMGYGIYKSEDRGVNWTKLVVAGSDDAKPTDLEMDPQNSQALYAGFLGKGIFKTTDGGATWCPLNPGIPLPMGCPSVTGLPNPTLSTFDHVEVSIHRPTAAQAAVLYAVFGNCPNPIITSCSPSIYKSTDGGDTWALMKAAGPSSYSRYTHVLTIHPADPATIYFGGLRLHKSINSGMTFTETGTCTLHPDHQAVVFADPASCRVTPAKCNRMYNASDGGFAYSTDGGATWQSGNDDLQITGFQSITASPLTDRVIGGTQDNGTNMWLGSKKWEHKDDGDSASTIIDLDSASVMYDVYVDVDPRRSKNGGACCSWPDIQNGLNTNDPSAFYPPFVQDPTSSPGQPDPSIFPSYHKLYFGTNRLYRSAVPPAMNTLSWSPGDSWEPVSPVLGGMAETFPDINRTNVITAIAVAPSNPNRIYIGYYDGQIFRTQAAGPCAMNSCWTNLTKTPLPQSVITRIAVHPTNPDIAYVTFSGFNVAGCARVYKTTNGGTTWNAASGPNPCDPNDLQSLPDIPANTISIQPSDPDQLWLGTDIGVFGSVNGGVTWVPVNGITHRLPNVPVYEIAIDEVHDKVIAGTHGRGAFLFSINPILDFYAVACKPPCRFDLFLFMNAVINPPDEALTIQLIQANGKIFAESRLDAQGAIVTASADGEMVSSKTGFYNGRPGAWAVFNGTGVGGVDLFRFNEPDNPITAVAVISRGQKTTKNLSSSLQQPNPPSTTVTLSGFQTAAAGQEAKQGTGIPSEGAFNLVANVQQGDGSVRFLCEVSVPFRASDTVESVLLRARDAINLNLRCAVHGLRATVQGLTTRRQRAREDEPLSDPKLELSASRLNGVQLITSLRTDPGRATDLFFDVGSIGVPVRNALMPMKLEFSTATGGARGGQILIEERSPLGSCAISIPTVRGAAAREIAAAVAEAFQARGIPGPHPNCPASRNPRDVVADGNAVTTVLAAQLVVSVRDAGIGFTLQPQDLLRTRTGLRNR